MRKSCEGSLYGAKILIALKPCTTLCTSSVKMKSIWRKGEKHMAQAPEEGLSCKPVEMSRKFVAVFASFLPHFAYSSNALPLGSVFILIYLVRVSFPVLRYPLYGCKQLLNNTITCLVRYDLILIFYFIFDFSGFHICFLFLHLTFMFLAWFWFWFLNLTLQRKWKTILLVWMK